MHPVPNQQPARPSRVIGITLGDAAGIGPEVIGQALDSGKLDSDFTYRVVGEQPDCTPGEPTETTARAALAALEEAAQFALAGEIDAVVTGPIHKARMQAIGFPFPGQTEFFATRCGVEDFAMLLTGGMLTMALVTAHVPLRRVAEALRESEIVRVGKLLAEFVALRRRAAVEPPSETLTNRDAHEVWPEQRSYSRPRIAVAGLNPHAGESGALGSEEIDVIEPAVQTLRLNGYFNAQFEGPVSPDTVFHRAANGEFDAVLCMYHDQGLIPLKLHAFDQGVNVTLGLPFFRTSPDHGTAFEIAGRGIARPDSTIAAINLAAELTRKSSALAQR